MPPRRNEDYMDIDSVSEDSFVEEDEPQISRSKKGKGKATERTKKDKGKAKAKEVG